MVNSSQGIANIIQPRLLQTTPDNSLRQVLLASRQTMDEIVAASCADLVRYMGITPPSPVEHIQGLVAEFVSGWLIGRLILIVIYTSEY